MKVAQQSRDWSRQQVRADPICSEHSIADNALHLQRTLQAFTSHIYLQALLRFDPERREVSLTADRDYQAGERILAWCGPQPNSRVRR